VLRQRIRDEKEAAEEMASTGGVFALIRRWSYGRLHFFMDVFSFFSYGGAEGNDPTFTIT
jgi:hypothetical protein